MEELKPTRARLSPEERREVILQAAVRVTRANDDDPNFLTLHNVAEACGLPTSPATVRHYFDMPSLRLAVRERLDTPA